MNRGFAGSQNKETKRGRENEANPEVRETENLNEENEQGILNEEPNGNAGPSRKRKRTSPMWDHFTVKFVQKENAEFAFCNHCTK